MKRVFIATALVAAILANAISAQAAQRKTDRIDGYKLFDDIANRSGQ